MMQPMNRLANSPTLLLQERRPGDELAAFGVVLVIELCLVRSVTDFRFSAED